MPRLGRGISAHRARGLAPHFDGTGLDLQRRLEGAGGIAEGGFYGASASGNASRRACSSRLVAWISAGEGDISQSFPSVAPRAVAGG